LAELKVFNTVSEFIKAIDDQIAKLRSDLGSYLRDLDNIRAKAERLLKLEETLKKVGVRKEKIIETKELSLGGISIVINPTPLHDLKILEDIVKGVQDKLMVLENIRKNIEPLRALEDVEAKVEAYFKDGVPTKLLIRIE